MKSSFLQRKTQSISISLTFTHSSLWTCTQQETHNKCIEMFPSNLHWSLAGTGRGGGRGSSGSLGKQGLASKLVGTVLSSWARLLNSHLCCSCCRSLLIWAKRQTDFQYIHHFLHGHFNAQSCSVKQGHANEGKHWALLWKIPPSLICPVARLKFLH